MVQPQEDGPSVRRQCELLELARSGLYYEPVAVSAEEVALMRRIDELYTARPFLGSRRIVDALAKEGRLVNRKRVQRLMRVMGLESLLPGPHTSRPTPPPGRRRLLPTGPAPPSRAIGSPFCSTPSNGVRS